MSDTTPLHVLFSGLSAEELIAQEHEHRVPEPSTPSSILGKRASPSSDSDDDDEGHGSLGPVDEDPQSRSSLGARVNSGSLQIEQTIRRLGKRLKFSNGDVALLEQFTQEHSLEVRLVLLYANTVAIGNELAGLRQSIGTASYQIGEELENNIKKYSRLILLSPSIHHYKGMVPRDYLVKLVVKFRFGIPQNVEANGHAWAKITACIDYELTQARGRLKKILKKDASTEDAQSRSTVYQLTKAMVGDENYKISPAICTRVAIMREVYHSFPHGDFWDQVDKTLDSIKSMPEGQRFSYLKAILSRDRRRYSVAPGTVAIAPGNETTGGDEPLIQQRIEDLIEAPGGATTFQPPSMY